MRHSSRRRLLPGIVFVMVALACNKGGDSPQTPLCDDPLSRGDYVEPACHPSQDTVACRRVARRGGEFDGIVIARLDGTGVSELLPGMMAPAWDQSGQRLAVCSSRGKLAVYDLHLERLDLIPIGGSNWYPSWSPSGQHLAYSCTAPVESCGVWTVDLTDLAQHQVIAIPMVATTPAWSPLGDEIAFAGNEDPESDVWIVRLDGSNLRKVTSGSIAKRPMWSADGTRIVYSGRRGSHYAMFVVEVGQGGRSWKVPGSDAYCLSMGQSGSWARDGVQIVYNKECLWLTRMDGGGNHPILCRG